MKRSRNNFRGINVLFIAIYVTNYHLYKNHRFCRMENNLLYIFQKNWKNIILGLIFTFCWCRHFLYNLNGGFCISFIDYNLLFCK